MRNIDNIDIRNTVEDIADLFMDEVLYHIDKNREDLSNLAEILDDRCVDDTNAVDLNLNEKLVVLEHYADDYEVQLVGISVQNLRGRVETAACLVLHRLAQEHAREVLDDFEELLDENDLSLSQVTRSNEFGWFVHRSERQEGDHCDVYEYRGIEAGEVNVDVWHYMRGRFEVYIIKSLDADD